MLTGSRVSRIGSLCVDGVLHDAGDAAVLEPAQRDAFAATIPWSLELSESAASRLRSAIPALGSGRLNRDLAARVLAELRVLLLRSGGARPRFVLLTIERIEVDAFRVRVTGGCAPIFGAYRDPRFM